MREIIPHPIAWVDVQRHAEPLVRQFLQLRGIASLWLRQPANDRVGHRAMYYRFQHSAETTPIWTHRYTQAYAGSFWHALWVVSSGGGRMRESRDKGDGGEFHTPGFVAALCGAVPISTHGQHSCLTMDCSMRSCTTSWWTLLVSIAQINTRLASTTMRCSCQRQRYGCVACGWFSTNTS